MSSRNVIHVELGDRSYDVVVGQGAIADLPEHVDDKVKRIAVVTQEGIPCVDAVERVLASQSGRTMERIDIGSGETDKSLRTVEQICTRFAEMGLTRQDLVVGVGGGLVTDVAGFAASVWHRGTNVVHVPTTLLAMVDAAIGGKTGVNLPYGKNLVGSFWQPTAVICDLDALSTLPDREMRCGLGEISKYHFLTGDDLLALDLGARIARCIRIKADIVTEDEREGGIRALLNYGHTLAHALETVGGHSLAHGEAVAVGIAFAADLARALDRIDDGRVAYHRHVVEDVYGLDTRPPVGLDVDEIMETMARDKKALTGLTFILDSERGLEVVESVEPQTVRSVLSDFMDR